MKKNFYYTLLFIIAISVNGCKQPIGNDFSESINSSDSIKSDYESYIENYPGYTWGEEQWLIDYNSGALHNTISFETFGGKDIEPIYSFKGQEITISLIAEKDGEEFSGWYLEPELQNESPKSFISEKNITLYAKYAEKKLDIPFNSTPYLNEDNFWVINGVLTKYSSTNGELSISSKGFWMVGIIETDFVVYTTKNKPLKCIQYQTETIGNKIIEYFKMADDSLIKEESNIFDVQEVFSIGAFIQKQETINSIPEILLRVQTSNLTFAKILEHHRITNIENINFASLSNFLLKFNLFGKNFEIVLETTNDSYLIQGEQDYDFHTELQKTFLDSDILDIENYVMGDKELSKPVPYVITLSKQIPNDSNISIIELNSYFFEYDISDSLCEIYLYNFEVNKNYSFFIVINGFLTNRLNINVMSSEFRNLNVDGVTNFRDIGGKNTINGQRIKQGLFYRTATLNKSYSSKLEYLISYKGMSTLQALNIKTEVDLRIDDGERGKYTSTVIEGGRYFHTPVMPGRDIPDLEGNNVMIKNLFENILSDENNYPLIAHCSIGTDRTGLICYLLLGILGCDDNTILKDYLFSNFALINADRNLRSITISFTNSLSVYGGDTISENSLNYLLNIGVSQEKIDNIKNILLQN